MNWKVTTRCWVNCQYCGEAFGEDLGFDATKEGKARLLTAAQNNGWTHNPDGSICDVCSKEVADG